MDVCVYYRQQRQELVKAKLFPNSIPVSRTLENVNDMTIDLSLELQVEETNWDFYDLL